MAEEVEVGSDTEIGFAEVDEGGYVEDRVGIEMNQLDLIKIEKTAKEITGRETKPAVEKGFEDYDLVGIRGREGLTGGSAPSDDVLRWKHLILDHLEKFFLPHC